MVAASLQFSRHGEKWKHMSACSSAGHHDSCHLRSFVRDKIILSGSLTLSSIPKQISVLNQ